MRWASGYARAARIAAGPALGLGGIGLFWGAFAAWLPDVKARAGASDAEMGWVLLGSGLGGAAAMALYPTLARAFGARLLPGAAVLLAAAAALQLAGTSVPTLFLALAGMGFAISALDVACNVRLSLLEGRHGVPLMNLAHGLYSLCFAAAAAAAGVARGAGASQAVVVAAVALALLGVAPRLVAPLDVAEQSSRAARTPWAAVLPAGLILFAAFVAENATESWSALHIERSLGGARGEGAMGPAMMGLTMAIGRFAGQGAAVRWGEARLIVVSALVGAAGAVLLALAPSQPAAVLAVALIGAGCAVVVPCANGLLGAAVKPHQRPLGISRAWLLGFSGFFLGPVAVGWAAGTAGLGTAFLGVAAVLLLALPGAALLRRMA